MTWGKILVGILAAMCLLAVGALEVVSERRSSSHLYSDRVGDVRPEAWDTGVAEPVFTVDGQAQRIVLLRHDARELEAAER